MTSINAVRGADDAAVRTVLDHVYAAWEVNDADAFVVPYVERATAQLPGSCLQGREAIRATMATVFAAPLEGSRGLHEVQSIRFLGADVAVVISKGAVVMAGQTEPAAESRSLETRVLGKQDGKRRVEAFHNCPEQVA